jgi:hypothetical protein
MNESEAYSAKAARAGKDIGKPGKNFEKIAAKAAKKYGSEERGKKVAGAILRNLRMKEDLAYLHTLEYLDQENIELESLSEEQINELLAGFRQRKVNRLEKKADQLERINQAKSRIRAAKRVSRQNSKVRKVGRAIGKALFGKPAVKPKSAVSVKPRPVAKPAVKPVSSVRPKPKKLGEEQVKKESLTYSKFSKFLRNEETGYINIGEARVKNDEKSVLQHIQKTFPNVKKVKKDPQHGWSPVFKEEVELEENYRVLATKGIGAERREDIKVGHGVDYYHPKDGNKHRGKIHSMNDKGYVVRDDKTGEKHKFQYYRRMEEEVELEEAKSRIDSVTAKEILTKHDALGKDFHTLSRSQVDGLVSDAKAKKYRKSASASGSTGRMFHQHLSRLTKEDVEQIDEVKVGQRGRLVNDPKTKTGSGYAGEVVKVDGNTVYLKVGSDKFGDRIVKGSMNRFRTEEVKTTFAKLRQKAYGDPSAGKSVMTKEDAEQVDEISKTTLKSYSAKAEKQTRGNQPYDTDALRKRTNREKGLKSAYNKYYGYKTKIPATEEVEQVDEKAPPGKKYERMVKHIKKGYEGGGLTKQEKGIAYATAWKSYNKGK